MFKNLKKKKNNKGFTLVELLVVIAIIGILAVVAVPSLFKQIDKAKATQIVANIKAIQTEVFTEYANSDGLYTIAGNVNGNVGPGADKIIPVGNNKISETYAVAAATAVDSTTGTYTAASDNATAAKVVITVSIDSTLASKYGDVLENVSKQIGASINATKTQVVLEVSK